MPDSDDDGRKASPKARLRKTLIDEVQGKANAVLVLGDGMNLQSGEPSGRGSAGGWNRGWKRSGEKPRVRADDFNRRNLSAVSLWSAVVRQWSACQRTSTAHGRGRAVRVRVSPLQVDERARKPPGLVSEIARRTLRQCRLVQSTSGSFLHSGTTRIVHRGVRGSFLGRHIEVSGSRGRTKVW
jgi:hypothetical protein